MQWPRTCPSGVLLFGYILFAFGALSMIQYFVGRYIYGRPVDMGIALGSGAIVLIGLVAISIAKCLVGLEERLDKIESARSPLQETGRGARPSAE